MCRGHRPLCLGAVSQWRRVSNRDRCARTVAGGCLRLYLRHRVVGLRRRLRSGQVDEFVRGKSLHFAPCGADAHEQRGGGAALAELLLRLQRWVGRRSVRGPSLRCRCLRLRSGIRLVEVSE